MRKLTASLVGVVMGGGILIEPVHADIASKAYVDGKITSTTTDLSKKQDVSNLVNESGYNSVSDPEADSKYPSVKAVKTAIKTETDSIKGDVESLETDIENQKNNIVKSEEYSTVMDTDESRYPSVTAVKDAIRDATSDMATNANLNLKQDVANLVKNANYATTDEDADTKYPSVLAVKGAITAATADLAEKSDVDAVESSVESLGGKVTSVESGLDTKIPKPTGSCNNSTSKCVLTFDGSNGYAWEVIQRADNENGES